MTSRLSRLLATLVLVLLAIGVFEVGVVAAVTDRGDNPAEAWDDF